MPRPATVPDDVELGRLFAEDQADRADNVLAPDTENRDWTRRALAAAALDRWLMHTGLPQKYGTQYTFSGGSWRMYPVEPETSNEERARWFVPPLAVARERAGQMNLDGV